MITGHQSLRSKFAAGVRKRRRSGKRGAAARGWGGRQSTQKVGAIAAPLLRAPTSRTLALAAGTAVSGVSPGYWLRSLVVVALPGGGVSPGPEGENRTIIFLAGRTAGGWYGWITMVGWLGPHC